MSHLNRLYCCSCRDASLICRNFRESQSTNSLNRATLQSEARWAMFHLDYLSCFLTILATILLARKSWVGLFIAIVNSLIVCAIALRTSQLGFIPANLFCICIYGFSMRPWLKEQTHLNRPRNFTDAVTAASSITPSRSEPSDEALSRNDVPLESRVPLESSEPRLRFRFHRS